jgi:hypothetical protein
MIPFLGTVNALAPLMSSTFREQSEGGGIKSGASVAFRLGDATCPDQQQVLSQIGPNVTVCGEVVFLSDRGFEKRYYAIVSATGIDTPIVVPVEKLTCLGQATCGRSVQVLSADSPHQGG